MRRPTLIALLLGALAPLAVVIEAQARDRSISTDRTATNLSAFGQGLAWSRQSPSGSRLVMRAFGTPTDVPVPPASGDFDPDLGRDAEGHAVVVYTRCAGISGRNCDVYEYDFTRAAESKVSGASSSRCSEFAPSVWNGTIAFGRSGPKGCRGLYVKATKGSALQLESRIPADTDIRQGKVAYLYAPSAKRTSIRLFPIKQGQSRPVITGINSGGERTRVSSPAFGGGYLYWVFEDLRRHEFKVGRSRGRPNSSLQFSDRHLPRRVDSIAVDARTVFYTNGRGVFEASDPAPGFTVGDL